MIRDKCLICGSNELEKVIDLGVHPFADTFIKKNELDKSELIYPLIVCMCKKCYQFQTYYASNPLDRYTYHEYSYTSSNSDFSRTHWEQFANEMIANLKLEQEDTILEIGSNDGYLLSCFDEIGYSKVLGIDPSHKMAMMAKMDYDIDTICELFPLHEEAKKYISKQYGKFKLIVANNVFNHSEYPVEFVKQVAELLREDGVFVFELPYWKKSIQEGKVDQIYHEHVSYFTALSSFNVVKKSGLSIFKIEEIDYHGGSIRVYCTKHSDDCVGIKEMFTKEEEFGLYDVQNYCSLMQKALKERNTLMKKIYDIKLNDGHIVAVGAAAKGNTFLNFCKLDNSLIDYVTDSSPYKQGKYTPLTRIPIVGDEIFASYKDKKVYALILSWNISTQIKKILKDINENIEFISLGI